MQLLIHCGVCSLWLWRNKGVIFPCRSLLSLDHSFWTAGDRSGLGLQMENSKNSFLEVENQNLICFYLFSRSVQLPRDSWSFIPFRTRLRKATAVVNSDDDVDDWLTFDPWSPLNLFSLSASPALVLLRCLSPLSTTISLGDNQRREDQSILWR